MAAMDQSAMAFDNSRGDPNYQSVRVDQYDYPAGNYNNEAAGLDAAGGMPGAAQNEGRYNQGTGRSQPEGYVDGGQGHVGDTNNYANYNQGMPQLGAYGGGHQDLEAMRQLKQSYLRREIIERNYDQVQFGEFLAAQYGTVEVDDYEMQ